MSDEMPNPLNPNAALLVKLGSIAVHTKEMLSPTGHGFDRISTQQLLDDPEIVEWVEAMDKMALLPKMRGT